MALSILLAGWPVGGRGICGGQKRPSDAADGRRRPNSIGARTKSVCRNDKWQRRLAAARDASAPRARGCVQPGNKAIYVLQMSEPFFTPRDTNASRASSSNGFNVRDYWDEAARHNYPSLRLYLDELSPSHSNMGGSELPAAFSVALRSVHQADTDSSLCVTSNASDLSYSLVLATLPSFHFKSATSRVTGAARRATPARLSRVSAQSLEASTATTHANLCCLYSINITGLLNQSLLTGCSNVCCCIRQECTFHVNLR